MNKHKIMVLITIAVLALGILACGFSASTANIKTATLARDNEGTQPTTAFSQSDTFYCLVELANAPDDTKVKASWTAVEAEGANPNTFLDQAELTGGSGTLHFKLSNNGPWPKGKYKVELYLNDKLDRTLDFSVE